MLLARLQKWGKGMEALNCWPASPHLKGEVEKGPDYFDLVLALYAWPFQDHLLTRWTRRQRNSIRRKFPLLQNGTSMCKRIGLPREDTFGLEIGMWNLNFSSKCLTTYALKMRLTTDSLCHAKGTDWIDKYRNCSRYGCNVIDWRGENRVLCKWGSNWSWMLLSLASPTKVIGKTKMNETGSCCCCCQLLFLSTDACVSVVTILKTKR